MAEKKKHQKPNKEKKQDKCNANPSHEQHQGPHQANPKREAARRERRY